MIKVDHLTKRYQSITAVDGLSFEVGPGRITGFLGPNGAGKTTTLRMLLGLAAPSSGIATINGVRYRDLPNPGRTVGAALDNDCFHPGRSAIEHLRAVATAAGISRRRPEQVLGVAGLCEARHRRVDTFSLGMRQRLTLATALLGDPGVLIMDEPLNGLDPDGIRWMRDLLRQQASDGRTVLISSHLLAEAAQTVDDVVVINHGKLAAQGPVADLAAATSTTRIRTLDAGQDSADGLSWDGVPAMPGPRTARPRPGQRRGPPKEQEKDNAASGIGRSPISTVPFARGVRAAAAALITLVAAIVRRRQQ